MPRKNSRSFQRLIDRFTRNGSVKYEMHEGLKPVINEGNEFNVHASVVEDPHRSTADISGMFTLAQTSLKRILRKNKFHPYRLQLTQALDRQDFGNGMNFYNWSLARIEEQCIVYR